MCVERGKEKRKTKANSTCPVTQHSSSLCTRAASWFDNFGTATDDQNASLGTLLRQDEYSVSTCVASRMGPVYPHIEPSAFCKKISGSGESVLLEQQCGRSSSETPISSDPLRACRYWQTDPGFVVIYVIYPRKASYGPFSLCLCKQKLRIADADCVSKRGRQRNEKSSKASCQQDTQCPTTRRLNHAYSSVFEGS
jgi:hypothetical protein